LESLPKISIIIPIRNEARFIERTIRYVQEQDYPKNKLEILVVVGDSVDDTAAIVQRIAAEDPRVTYIHNPRSWSSAARNLGIENATGEIITFIDGHTYIDNNQLLQNTAKILREQNVSVLSRPQFLDTPENSHFQQAVSLARKSVAGHGLDSTIYNDRDELVDPTSSGASYRREVVDKVGRFDERFDACEDVEFNHRVAKSGFGSFTSLKLAVYYYPRESLRGLFQQMTRYGVGRFRLACKHPDTLSPGTLVPFLFTVGLPLLAVLSFLHPLLRYLFLAAVGLYALLILPASLVVAARHGWSFFFVLPPIYLAVHTGLGYGFLKEMIRTITGRGNNFSNDRHHRTASETAQKTN
jgi:succinoglycan biosynthesis protein ExoA